MLTTTSSTIDGSMVFNAYNGVLSEKLRINLMDHLKLKIVIIMTLLVALANTQVKIIVNIKLIRFQIFQAALGIQLQLHPQGGILLHL